VTHSLNYTAPFGGPPSAFTGSGARCSGLAMENAGRWVFSEYCPQVFCKIREIFGVRTSDYENSLGLKELVGNLLVGKLRSYQEVFSTL
jgi:hypothetical protein